MNARASHYSRL